MGTADLWLFNMQDESAQSQGGYSTQAILPQAGQFRSVELSNGQGRIVLLLLAEPVVQVWNHTNRQLCHTCQ